MPDAGYDARFSALARELRFATDRDLEIARRLQETPSCGRQRPSLGEILLRQGALTLAQHEAIDRRVRLQPDAEAPAARRPMPRPHRPAAPRKTVPAPMAFGFLGVAALAAGLATSGALRSGGSGEAPPAPAAIAPGRIPFDEAAGPAAAATDAPPETARPKGSLSAGAAPPPPSQPAPPPLRPDGLVGHWRLDEGAGVTAGDASGQGHRGTLRGRPAWTPGRVGGALAFDGKSDCVDTTFKTDLAQWTVACWVRSPEPPAARFPSGPVHRERGLQICWDHPIARFRGAAGVCVRNEWHLASFGPLPADRWVHLAATYDGETLRAYADGALITENPGPSGPPDPERFTLKIGAHAFGTAFFRGSVDDVRLYNRALDADAIRRLAGAE